MNYLFVHQSFPAQYEHIARHLVGAGHNVVAISRARDQGLEGVRRVRYARPRTDGLGPDVAHYVRGIRNGQAVAGVAEDLKRSGFDPHVVAGHAGWGEILFLKDVWPDRPLLGYFEWYGGVEEFDPEFRSPHDPASRRGGDAVDLMAFHVVDRGQTPTEVQRASYPKHYWNDISVVHDGIDTNLLRPDRETRVWLGDRLLAPGDEIITYSARSLEPHRGFHVFMRALPRILRRRRKAHVLIMGSSRVSYSPPCGNHRSYAEQLMAEIDGSADRSRIHFLGYLPPEKYRAVLRLSAAHVYLTYPFVLSWSLLEAMSTGCLVVGSRTPPVEEVMTDGKNGLLFDFFDGEGLADRVCDALAHPERMRPLRAAARKTVVRRYDVHSVCLPAQLRMYRRLVGSVLHSASVAGGNRRCRPGR